MECARTRGCPYRMTNEQMHTTLDGLAVGDEIKVRHTGGRTTRYTVTSITGSKARQIHVVGKYGAKCSLLGTGPDIWFIGREGKTRRVLDLTNVAAQEMADALAQAAAASRRLPDGYTIETERSDTGLIWHVAMCGSTRVMPHSIGRKDPLLAVIDAWANYADSQVSEHSKTVVALESAQQAKAVAEADAARCRRALQQIREVTASKRASGKQLPDDVAPEQVVADVAHAKAIKADIDQAAIWSVMRDPWAIVSAAADVGKPKP